MNVALSIAALASLLLALGHATAGRPILPTFAERSLPQTVFGPPSLTLSMLRFTWHGITVLLVATSILLAVLAATSDIDPKTMTLRWLAGLWLASTLLSLWESRQTPSNLLRFPVPAIFLAVSLLCWTAST